MGFIWRYAWANYLTIAAFHRPFPLPEAMVTLGAGSLLVYVSLERGWRVIWVLFLQVFGFALVFLRILYAFYDWSFPFIHPGWLLEFISRTKGPLDWLAFAFLLLWALIFWFGGWYIARKPCNYYNTCARFDIGVAFLLLLFLIKYVVWYKGGTAVPDPLSGAMILPFFLFSLLAIAMARNRSEARREYMPGHKGAAVILGFIFVVLLLGTGVILFLLPYLTLAAKTGYSLIQVAARPMGPFFVGILRFLFQPRKMRTGPESSFPGGNSSDLGIPVDGEFWAGPAGEIVRIALMALLGLLMLTLCIILLWLFYKWILSRFTWLFSRTSNRRGHERSLLTLLSAGFRTLLRLLARVKGLMKGRQKGAVQLYTALLSWGRHSGLPCIPSETPLEYGTRLITRFPVLKTEVESIIELFNREVYGGIAADGKQLTAGRLSWRRLRSPAHWLTRFKAWSF